jgi:hypothetical protein
MKVVFPNDVVWSFYGLITAYELGMPVDDKLTASMTVKVTAIVTVT